jgi:D-alanyl-D-alanine endopeptidase (penicillin-binding protein 7)
VLQEQQLASLKEQAYTTASISDSLIPEESFYEPEESSKTKISPTSAPFVPTTPTISAKAYLAGNIVTKEIYLEKNSGTALPVASMSKLITAFAVTDMLPLDTKITITKDELNVPVDASKLTEGEIFTVGELLNPLLMNSSNVAAEALASSSDRSKFLDSMEGYAWEVGMPKTLFDDPTGLSPKNVSTARDFFALAQYLYKSRPDILAITRIPTSSISSTTEHGAHNFTNIHPFVLDPDFLGGKTGHTTEARDTMLTIMNINNQPVAIIVISSNNRKVDTAMIIKKVKNILGQ